MGALGALLVALGPLRGPSGALLGPPGALLERILASRGALFRACWAFLWAPFAKSRKPANSQTVHHLLLLSWSRGFQTLSKTDRQSIFQPGTRSGRPGSGPGRLKIDLDGQKVCLDSQKAARRAQQTGRNPTELAQIKSPHVKRTSICSNMD